MLKRRVVPIVLGVIAAVLLVLFILWVNGSFERPPSDADRAAFTARIEEVASSLHGTAAPVKTEVVFGGHPYGPFSFGGRLEWRGYQYAVHYRIDKSDATWVQTYRPDMSDEDLRDDSFEPMPEEVAVMLEYHRLTGKTMMGRPVEYIYEGDDSLVAHRWELWDFDPKAGSDWFMRGGGELVEYRDGTYSFSDRD